MSPKESLIRPTQVLQFETLTPFWSGGADRDSDQPRETGLIGSLRFWYEGIVRSMGGRTCLVVGEAANPCRLDTGRYEEGRSDGLQGPSLLAYAGLCPACQLFGTTGWQRRFRLELHGLHPHSLFFQASRDVYEASGNWLWRMFGGEKAGGTRIGRGAGVKFTFATKALWGNAASIKVVTRQGGTEGIGERLGFLLNIAARFAGVGARTQNGFGQIRFLNARYDELLREGREWIRSDIRVCENSGGQQDNQLFNLRHLFSCLYRVDEPRNYLNQLQKIGLPGEDYGGRYIPCAFDIRYKSRQKNRFTKEGSDFGMRPWFRERCGNQAAHVLFGRSNARSDDERSAGRIKVSHLFRLPSDNGWYLKVWGYVPPGIRSKDGTHLNPDTVRNEVEAFLSHHAMFSGISPVDVYSFEEVIAHA